MQFVKEKAVESLHGLLVKPSLRLVALSGRWIMFSMFSKINVQECDSTFCSRIVYLLLMAMLIFSKRSKEWVVYSPRAK